MPPKLVPANDLPSGLVPAEDLPTGISSEEFTRQRQESATQEPAFRALSRAAIPTIAAGASFLPPVAALGLTGQAVLGAGATGLNQLLGLEEPSFGEIAKAGAFPLVAGGLVKMGKSAFKGIGEIIQPGAVREAGVEAIAGRIGQKETSLKRVFSAPASRAAFQAVRNQGPLVTDDVVNALDTTLDKIKKFDPATGSGMANPPTRAVAQIKNVRDKFAALRTADYGDVVEEVQSMKRSADALLAQARPDGNAARAILDARAKILDVLDDVSPAIKKANALYRREQSSQELVNAMRSSNPGDKVRKLFENDALVARSFSKEEVKDIYHIADAISNVASASPMGGFRQLLSAITEPIGQGLSSETGRYLLRQTMQPNKSGGVSPTVTSLATVAQFMRAYVAQGGLEREVEQKFEKTPEAKKEFQNKMKSPDVPIEKKIEESIKRADKLKEPTIPDFLQRHFDRQSSDNL